MLLAVAIWASAYIKVKDTLLQLPPNTIAFMTFLVAGIPLGLYLLFTKQPKIKKSDWIRLAFCGLTGFSLYEGLQNTALQYAGPTDAAILTCMSPVFIALLAWLLLKEKISKGQTLGIIIAFVGSVVVATSGSLTGLAVNPQRIYGDALLILSGMSWALYCIKIKPLLEAYPETTVLAYTNFAGALFLLPMCIGDMRTIHLASVNLSGWLNILYLGLCVQALAYLLWNLAYSRVKTLTAAAYVYLIPVLTAIMSTIYYKQLPGWATIIGGGIVILGTIISTNMTKSKK